jgi:hypothetical protein
LDVIIRNVPPKAYREFKARAAKLGLRIGEALKEAMESWATSTEGGAGVLQDRDDDAFRRMKSTLEREYRGKYVAMVNGQLAAVADTMEQLAAELRRRKIARCHTVHLGVDESGEGGEWLWSSIGQEIATSTITQ